MIRRFRLQTRLDDLGTERRHHDHSCAITGANFRPIDRSLQASPADRRRRHGIRLDGRPYFAMELVQGIPFTQYCDRNKLTPNERLELFIPVCQAIQHVHQKGIIHRDIKPSNVLVTPCDGKPVPKVIEFGLAKALQSELKLTDKTMFTEFGQVVGTLQYMSPEQAEMNALDVDTRKDIYSLGVMLYELLTGSTPLDKQSMIKMAQHKILEQIREKDPPRPSTPLSESGDAITDISEQRKITPSKLQHHSQFLIQV